MSRLHRCDVDRRQVYTLKSTPHLPILHLHTIQDPFDVLLDNRRWLCRSCRNTRMRKGIFYFSSFSSQIQNSPEQSLQKHRLKVLLTRMPLILLFEIPLPNRTPHSIRRIWHVLLPRPFPLFLFLFPRPPKHRFLRRAIPRRRSPMSSNSPATRQQRSSCTASPFMPRSPTVMIMERCRPPMCNRHLVGVLWQCRLCRRCSTPSFLSPSFPFLFPFLPTNKRPII